MSRRLFVILSLFVLPWSIVRGETGKRVEFNRDIRPILSENCFYCHGFDEQHREAGLRLDTFEGATEDLGGYTAIEPGDADASELVSRILSDDPDQVMPPPETEQSLTSAQKELVRRWIDQGAQYQEHWAWKELQRPNLPSDKTGEQSGSWAIDALLQSTWRENAAQPVERATPRERLRRLSLDLRGLLPSHEQVQRFTADPSDEHFHEFRDQWMSELSYAEHQSVRWLDLVRWADTSGFVSDEPIASGAYRAWIIDAIRNNQPFDQFSIEQLAGDLLPEPTDPQLVASGYNRIVNTNCEAGAIEEEQLYKLKGEHVRALGTVWLGMTTGCAECHDHKFDPILAKDYYSLGAFFDDLVEAGVYTPGDRREPLHYVYEDSPVDSKRDRNLRDRVETLKKEMASKTDDGLESWLSEMQAKAKDSKSHTDFVWVSGQLPAARVIEGHFQMVEKDGQRVRETDASTGKLHRHAAAELITGYLKSSAQKTDDQKDVWFVNVWIDPEERPDLIGFQISNGSYGRLGWQTASYETYYWGEDTSGTLATTLPWSSPKRVKRIGDLPSETGWVRLEVPFKELIKGVPGKSFDSSGMSWLHIGGHLFWGDSGLHVRTDKATALMLGETAMRKWWEKPMNRQVFQRRAEYVGKAIGKSFSRLNDLEREVVLDAYREHTQPELTSELRSCESELFLTRSRGMPVLVSRQSNQRKTTRLLNRGDYQDKTGPLVQPAFPEFLAGDLKLQASPLTRLDLARWLFDQGSTLTARVFVNRLWHQFYGRGISETLEDSGTQGDWPSHPELLDWLACEFRDSGWDRDHMVRLMTSTKAYQLSSKPSEDLAQRDPGNRWHARQGRFRITAESIRDTSLQVASLLRTTTEIPKRSFFPYQPDAYWTRSDKVMYGSRHMIWETSAASEQYSRSLYSFWKRQNIHPSMLAFDAPTRQECTAKRNVTNTPGQALALLNDPIFVEAARVLAMRLCEMKSANAEQRIEHAFSLALQRQPSDAEVNVLVKLLSSQRTRYEAQPDLARQLTKVGQTDPPGDGDAVEVAAWTAVARAILNLHEFLNRS